MFDYRLSFDIEVKNTYSEIGVLIISTSYVPAWKCNATNQDLNTHYGNHGQESMISLSHHQVMHMHLF